MPVGEGRSVYLMCLFKVGWVVTCSVNLIIKIAILSIASMFNGFPLYKGSPVLLIVREYWVSHGLVTGGQYGSNQGCQPYLLPHCAHHEPGPYKNCSGEGRTPKCSTSCEPGYPKTYQEDLHYGATAYGVHGVEKIMTEIMTNGPVEGAFTVYSDFPTYKSG